MLQMLEDIRDGVTGTMVEIPQKDCRSALPTVRDSTTMADCKVAFTMAEDAHMSEVMHEKIQWTFVNVQQIWLEVREEFFKNGRRQSELSVLHCRGGVQIIFDSTLHKDEWPKFERVCAQK